MVELHAEIAGKSIKFKLSSSTKSFLEGVADALSSARIEAKVEGKEVTFVVPKTRLGAAERAMGEVAADYIRANVLCIPVKELPVYNWRCSEPEAVARAIRERLGLHAEPMRGGIIRTYYPIRNERNFGVKLASKGSVSVDSYQMFSHALLERFRVALRVRKMELVAKSKGTFIVVKAGRKTSARGPLLRVAKFPNTIVVSAGALAKGKTNPPSMLDKVQAYREFLGMFYRDLNFVRAFFEDLPYQATRLIVRPVEGMWVPGPILGEGTPPDTFVGFRMTEGGRIVAVGVKRVSEGALRGRIAVLSFHPQFLPSASLAGGVISVEPGVVTWVKDTTEPAHWSFVLSYGGRQFCVGGLGEKGKAGFWAGVFKGKWKEEQMAGLIALALPPGGKPLGRPLPVHKKGGIDAVLCPDEE